MGSRVGIQDHAHPLPVTVGVGIRPIWAKESFAVGFFESRFFIFLGEPPKITLPPGPGR